jgi:putative ABC transport system permease protein
MNSRTLLRRGLTFHRRSHLWVILGSTVSTAILVGALAVGDSVRYSLRRLVFDRLGRTEFALVSGDRFFRSRIADVLADRLGVPVAPLLQIRGIASAGGGRLRVNTVQVIGVDERFGGMGGQADLFGSLTGEEAILNDHLASRLGVDPGDELVLRLEVLDAMPKDAPLALDSESTLARRFRVKTLASDAQFGRFNLRADQMAPLTAFVSLSTLSGMLDRVDRANVLLIAQSDNDPIDRPAVEDAFHRFWTLDDAGLKLQPLSGRPVLELSSSRIFMEPVVSRTALELQDRAQRVLTYLVNEIRCGERTTPYSFVSAPGAPLVLSGMREDEIVLNSWLAEDLQAGEGDSVRLTYFVLGAGRELREASTEFEVKEVVPLQGIYADRELLPDFPGLADIESTRDWRPGIPIDLDRIRDRDEAYWDEFRGTPKAFVTLEAAQRMWANRFGNVTAIRFVGKEPSALEADLEHALDPKQLGFMVQDVKQEGLRASSQSVDFGQLFLGLSFFIIAAALLLTGLLFVFNIEQRGPECGLLLAVGFSRKDVRRLLLNEGAVLVFLGGLLGGVSGLLYNQLVLAALKTVWKGAVGTSALRMHSHPATILFGSILGMITAFFSIWLVARRMVKQPVSQLQRGLTRLDTVARKQPRASKWISLLSLIGVAVVVGTADFGRGREAFAVFFSAGILLLTSGIAFTNLILFRMGRTASDKRLNLRRIGIRGNARRRTRTLTLIGLLASGLFIVFTVGANRQHAGHDAEKRSAGTGGFALFGQSTVPILYDLDSRRGRRFYGLEGLDETDVSFVQFRVKTGDDASCLNLNRVSNPQLLGLTSQELSERGAFRFVRMTEEVVPQDPWSVLDRTLPEGVVPAVADNTVIQWGLGLSVGDTLEYTDEYGENFEVKLVGGLDNSIFQGNIIISERVFLQRYPSLSGYRLFLVDAPSASADRVSQDIAWALQDLGVDLMPAARRLAEFNRVENTYLSIFLILGSFGLVLGSVGIGIVVRRNVKEREGELALLRAVGFSRRSIKHLILSEHLPLILAGIGFGLAAALLASLPALAAPGGEVPYATILVLLGIVLINGVAWTLAAADGALKRDMISALRRE